MPCTAGPFGRKCSLEDALKMVVPLAERNCLHFLFAQQYLFVTFGKPT